MITVYGASDDLIEVEGDIREEFPDDHGYLIFSDGTVLSVDYNRFGIWRINMVEKPIGAYRLTRSEDREEDNYSDVFEYEAPVRWIAFATELVKKV